MANLNRIILMGQVKNEPELRFTVEGVPMAKFKLVVKRPPREGVPDSQDEFDIVAWRKTAEMVGNEIKPEDTILAEGRIHIRSVEQNMGNRRWFTEIVARSIQKLSPIAASDTMRTPELAGQSLPF